MLRICVFVILGSLLLQGCMVFGRRKVDQPISAEALSQVKKGTTKTEVVKLLGAPQEILFSNKALDPLREHAYIYEHSNQKATLLSLAILTFGNFDDKDDRVVVFFDDNDLVARVGASLQAEQASFGFPFGN